MAATPPTGSPGNRLQEKDFIQEKIPNPVPFWLWFALVAIVSALLWGGSAWIGDHWGNEIAKSPFLQVTNRQFSVFLWQFPELMRVNAATKTGYLTGFQYQDKVSLVLNEADDYVIAPPEAIFLYHAWKRLVSDEFAERPMPVLEFQNFLNYAEEWQPKNWSEAPKEYVALVAKLSDPETPKDLSTLPDSTLPRMVRLAFQGWRNFFKEGDAINQVKPTLQEMAQFLKTYPHYARNNWRNIMIDQAPHYLNMMGQEPEDSKMVLPADQLAPFLKVAFYNYSQAQKKA